MNAMLVGRGITNLIYLGSLFLLPAAGVFAHGLIEEQIATITKQLEESPDDFVLYARRAELHREHGDAKAARVDFKTALKICPEDAASLLAFARFERETNDLAAARSAVEACLRHHPGDPAALEEKARIHAALREWSEAAAAWEACLKASPNPSLDLLLSCADACCRAGSKARAVAVLGEAIQRYPRVISLRQRTGSLLIGLGDHAAARREFAALRGYYPSLEVRLLAEEADIWLKNQCINEARIAFLEARVAFASLPPARQAQSAIRALGEHINESLDQIEKSPNPKPR